MTYPPITDIKLIFPTSEAALVIFSVTSISIKLEI